MFPLTLLSYLFGKFSWQAPFWLQAIAKYLSKHIRNTLIALSVLLLSVVAYLYYDSLPKPIRVKAHIDRIYPTATHHDAKANPLDIYFAYDFSTLKEDQEKPSGEASVARIDLIAKEVKTGIELSPAKKGKWLWLNDRSLQFIPETDWPAGTDYTVTFDDTIFADDVNLAEHRYHFSTPPLSVKFSNTRLYQDPQDISVRRVISTLKFSHPIDKTSLEDKLSMSMYPKKASNSNQERPYSFTVSYSKNFREAYIQSEPVALPNQSNYMKLFLAKGVKSTLGGTGSDDAIKTRISIPDVYSFLKVKARSEIVRNEQNAPEQMVLLEFTDNIDKQEIVEKVQLYLLPKQGQPYGRNYWRSVRKINDNVLNNSKKISYQLIENEFDHAKLYSFKIDVPENRFLYIKINEGLTSVNKFIHASFYDQILAVANYPKELSIVGEGSVLTYSGAHELSILTRGISGLKYSIGRLLEGQLYHLISQTRGDISNPRFNNWQFNQENITDSVTKTVQLSAQHPKDANYSSIDLSPYLTREKNRYGLFFIDIKGYNPSSNRVLHNTSDKRLVLITDLGIIVKNNADNSHHLFVQSITTGNAVAGASVELLGKNGIAVYSGVTDESGHIFIPSTLSLDKEKTPTVYVVKSAGDLSFIPFDRRSRQIHLSKFNIGGVQSSHYQKNALNAYLFTDRGIYRPGEKINIAMIVKKFDLTNVEGIPLKLVIRGPRNKNVKEHKFQLGKMGFSDFQFQTDATTDTGQYQAQLHLVNEGGHRHYNRMLGSINFNVEEFQPDTMKITSKLLNVNSNGWNNNEKITAQVQLNNLFGTPAQNRKVSANLSIHPHSFYFKQFKDYTFTDANINNDEPLSLQTSLENKSTDADGIAKFELDLAKFQQGTYRLTLTVNGFDQAGGRSVTASNSTLISPLTTLVGYKQNGDLNYIHADSERTIEFIAIDPKLQQKESTKLTLHLKEIEKISTLVKQYNGVYKYQTINKEKAISQDNITIGKSGYQYHINTKNPGDFILEVHDDEDRILSKVNFSVVGFANLTGKIDKSAELQLKLNKDDYLPNEMIEMSIKAPYAGAGLITIETDKVHSHKWFKTKEESTIQHIRVPKNIEGNAYVNVTFVRDISSKEVFTSPLSYAVMPFSIDTRKRQIDIALKHQDIVRPGKAMDISFNTSKPARIAIFAVDEGILQVAHYKTPNPLAHFLKKRALNVDTLQILDLILPDFALIKEVSASGGGVAELAMRKARALAKNLNPFARKVNKPAVFWSGIYDANSTDKTIQFTVPDTFSGQLRLMAVAVAEDALGTTNSSAIARGPFVISPNVLTQAAPEDEFQVTVGVANIIEGSGKAAKVQLIVTPSEHLEIIGSNTTQLLIDEGSEGKFTFKVKAKNKLGVAQLTFTAKHKTEDATHTAKLSIRPASTYYSTFTSGFDNSGVIKLPVERQLYQDLAKQSVAAAASPLVLVDGLTSYLESYPHGCTEQVVSKVFPLVGLMSHPAYGVHIQDMQEHFSHLIDKLRERQASDGGFVFWPTHNHSAVYPSIYVMHFLLEAHEQGFFVPSDMLKRGKDYLNFYVRQQSTSFASARDRANAIYLLTRLGAITTNHLIDLEQYLNDHHRKAWQKDITATYMAATYKLLQKLPEAERLIEKYQLHHVKTRYQALDDFHSRLAVDAQYIYLLSKHFEKRAKALSGDSIHQLTEIIFAGQYNTISAAYSILALGAYSKLVNNNEFNENIIFKAIFADKQQQSLTPTLTPFSKASYPSANNKETMADKQNNSAQNHNTQNHSAIAELSIAAKTPLFYLNVQSGFNKTLPSTAIRQGLEVFRSFEDEQGNTVTTFEQGKELTVKLKIRALDGKSLSNIALIDLLPGGFEIIRSSVARTAYNWRADYIDIREDRIVYYGNFDSSVRELTYKVKLTAAGEFTIPPSYAESMYDRNIRAISTAGKFTVTPSL